ncbi:MAG: hypothetical protein D6775_11855 [Caldilineae bacterium]|nr:MAG: hypothetical protein D6775_11855 [Caldilineae bacterium]
MSQEHKRCQARTKAGTPCRNRARSGSDYCYVHRNYRPSPQEPQETRSGLPRAELESLVAELNDLASELQRLQPSYRPPAFDPHQLVGLLKSNLDRFTPEAVRGLQEALEGTSLEDFKDFETWKGMWFTLNYLVQLEAGERRDDLKRRLGRLPGVHTIADLKEMLADTPPEEFLKPDTWKGLWFVVNYELQNQARSLRRRLLGEE